MENTAAHPRSIRRQLLQANRVLCGILLSASLACCHHAGAQTETTSTDGAMQPVKTLPDLPDGITSFGAANCDGHLYVYGGHNGKAHDYYRAGQNGVTWRLDLQSPESWEAVNESVGRQGLAMVAHGGSLYRMGGFEARNEEGEEHNLHSVADFEIFNPAAGSWESLEPMPTPRSSFDAVVVGDDLYVIGGWVMAGKEKTEWLNNACTIDLSDPEAQWQEIAAPPFVRRALSTASHNDKIYVIGGMQEKGGPTRKVDVFDTATGEWSAGPELPGDVALEGFGNSSFDVGGSLIVSTYGGNVYELGANDDEWIHLGTLEAGSFHRLIPVSEQEFVLIGGANMESGKTLQTPVFGK